MMGWEGGEVASGWKKRRECVGGGGRRRCGGGWGSRRTAPRGTVVGTDAGERVEQLDRGGEQLLPTCRVREGGGEHMQLCTPFAGKAAWGRGANSSADRSKGRRSSPEVFRNACWCETAWGTNGGTRRTCRSAEWCARESAPRRGSALAIRLAIAATSAASVLDRPPAQHVTGYTVAPEAACGHTVETTCHRLFHTATAAIRRRRRRSGAHRWLQVRPKRAECARRCARVGQVGPGQKPACARCVPVSRSKGGGTVAWVCKSRVRRRMWVGGGGGAGAGATFLAGARVVVGACRAP